MAGMRGRRAGAVVVLGALVASIVGVVASAAPAGAVDCAPIVTADDAYTITFGHTLTVLKPGVLGNDTGTGLTVDLDSSDTDTFNGGTVVLQTNGRVAYTPDPTFTGEDSFDYWVLDACGDFDLATVTVDVLPVVGNDSYTTKYNTALKVKAPGVLANDQGYDSAWSWAAKSTKGGTVTGADDGSFTYTPKSGYSGSDSFTYQVIDRNFDNIVAGTVTVTVGAPPVTTPPTKPPTKPVVPQGYWMVEANGTVHPFGQVKNYGNASTTSVTHFEPTATHKGYWIVNGAGHVFPFGDAKSYGSAKASSLVAGEIVSSLSATATGKGYWLFTSRGRVLPFGDAHFYGDMARVPLNGPVVGSIATPTGKGYYMVGSDGGIFTFGDAVFRGSMGAVRLDQPVQGLVPTSDNRGYWLVASDGGIFAFGNATFRGSMGGTRLNAPIVGMVRYGKGYLMVGSDGGIFSFSDKPFLGSLGANPPAVPIVSVAA